jgi:hypothetical protein
MNGRPALDAAATTAEAIERLQELIAKAQRGEIACVAVRVFQKDGSWEDVVIGGASDDQRAQALQALQDSYRVAN